MAELQRALQLITGTTLDAQGAANAWAGTTGLDLVGALNVKAGTVGLELAGVLNRLAGTTNLGVNAAAERLAAVPSVSGLKLWLAADRITGLTDGQTVATWNDVSGNGFNATQATEANKPTYRTNVINGKPVLRFDGTNDALALSGGALDILRNVTGGTIFAVAKSTAAAQIGDVIFISTPTAGLSRLRLSQNATPNWNCGYRRLDADGADEVSDGAVNTSPHVLSLLRNYTAATASLFVDGTLGVTDATANTAGSTSDTASNHIGIGASTSIGSRPFPGDIAEVICYARALTTEERRQVEQYLGGKYNITVSA